MNVNILGKMFQKYIRQIAQKMLEKSAYNKSFEYFLGTYLPSIQQFVTIQLYNAENPARVYGFLPSLENKIFQIYERLFHEALKAFNAQLNF